MEGAAGVGAFSKLAANFEGNLAIDAYEKVLGFKRGVQEKIIERNGGDLSRLDELVEEAKEGVFEICRCGGRVGCEIARDIIEGEIMRSEFEELVSDI